MAGTLYSRSILLPRTRNGVLDSSSMESLTGQRVLIPIQGRTKASSSAFASGNRSWSFESTRNTGHIRRNPVSRKVLLTNPRNFGEILWPLALVGIRNSHYSHVSPKPPRLCVAAQVECGELDISNAQLLGSRVQGGLKNGDTVVLEHV